MDLEAGAESNHREENDNRTSYRSNNDSNTGPVRNVRQFLRRVIEMMKIAQSSNANAMLVPPEADSPSHILTAFCNELLYEVFMHLHFLDLLNVAKVCVRFQGQAHAAFVAKYKSLVLKRAECDQEKVESILCEFGSCIRSLYVSSNNDAVADGALFRAIIQNCTTELTALDLFNVNIQVESPQFRLPFPKLEELELSNCKGNISLAHLIDDCPQLKRITIISCSLNIISGMIDRKFEKLEHLHFSGYDGGINDDVLERFITLNPQLLHLCVEQFSGLNTSHAIRLIGQNLLKLKMLHLKMNIAGPYQSDFEYIGQLRSLECLRLDFNDLDATPLIRALVKNRCQITSLHIHNGSIDDITIRCISQLKQLECLEMHVVDLNYEYVIGLARDLPNLQEFFLFSSNDSLTINGLIQMLRHAKKLRELNLIRIFGTTEFIINMDDYNTMLDIIRKRPEKIGLRLDIKGQQIKLNVPEAILEEKCDTLCIECEAFFVLGENDDD